MTCMHFLQAAEESLGSNGIACCGSGLDFSLQVKGTIHHYQTLEP